MGIAALSLLILGCVGPVGSPVPPAPTPFAPPPAVIVLKLDTWWPTVRTDGWICLEEVHPPLRPARSSADPSRVVFKIAGADASTSEQQYQFPAGYSAWDRDGRVVIVDREGRILGDPDDVLKETGGPPGVVCKIDGRVIRPW